MLLVAVAATQFQSKGEILLGEANYCLLHSQQININWLVFSSYFKCAGLALSNQGLCGAKYNIKLQCSPGSLLALFLIRV